MQWKCFWTGAENTVLGVTPHSAVLPGNSAFCFFVLLPKPAQASLLAHSPRHVVFVLLCHLEARGGKGINSKIGEGCQSLLPITLPPSLLRFTHLPRSWVLSLGWGDPLKDGNSNLLQYSCLENPLGKGAWWLQSIGLKRIRHDWSNSFLIFSLSSCNSSTSTDKLSSLLPFLSLSLDSWSRTSGTLSLCLPPFFSLCSPFVSWKSAWTMTGEVKLACPMCNKGEISFELKFYPITNPCHSSPSE